MMQELYDGFHKYNEIFEYTRGKLQKTLDKRKKSVASLEKMIEKMEIEHEGWVQQVLKPLADTISRNLGNLPYEFYGPFGLTSETSVYFFPGEGRDITKDESFGIDVVPAFESEELGGFHLLYWTGETTEEYRRGSIGWMNGMNKVRKELPDSIDEIMPLICHYHPKEAD